MIYVTPLAHAIIGQKVLPAKPFELIGLFLGLPDMVVAIPDIKQCGKIRQRIVEAGMHLIGFGRFFQRAFPRIEARRRL